MPAGVENAKDMVRGAKRQVANGDSSISAETMTGVMSSKPIANTVTALGNKEQQWEAENPKTAVAANVATLAIPGLGWGGAATRGVMFARAGATAYKAEKALRVAEAGAEVAHAGRVANAAGHEIPAVLRSQGQATRIVNAEHVAEASETAKSAGKAVASAGREAKDATKLAAKTSVEPAFMITADHMADTHRAETSANSGAEAPLNPGSALHSMRQESNQGQAQQPLMMPMSPAPAADPLAPLGGHSGDLRAVGGAEAQQHDIGSGNAMHTPLTQESHHGLGGHETNQPGVNLTTGGGNENTFGDGLMGATGADSGSPFGSNAGQRPAPRVNYNPTPNEGSSSSTPAPGGRGGDAKDSGPGVRGSR